MERRKEDRNDVLKQRTNGEHIDGRKEGSNKGMMY